MHVCNIDIRTHTHTHTYTIDTYRWLTSDSVTSFIRFERRIE